MSFFRLKGYEWRRPKHQAGSNRWVSRFFTLAAAVIVLMVNGVWLIAAISVPMPSHPEANRWNRPAVSYLATDDGTGRRSEAATTLLTRSPVLLALPTPVGYSGPLLEKASLEKLPAFNDKPSEFLRTLAEPFQVGPYGKSFRSLEVMVGRPRPQAVPTPDRSPGALGRDTPSSVPPLAAYWLDAPSVSARALSIPGAETAAPWEAQVFLYVNDEGRVEKAFLERPTAQPSINSALLHAVRSLVFDDAPAGGGRLLVRYQPPSARKDG